GWSECFCYYGNNSFDIEVTYTEPSIVPAKQPPAYHFQKLSEQLASIRLNGCFSDVTICATLDGKEFPAHKVILASRSSVFAAMFSHEELEENKNKRVDIPEVSGQVLEAFLEYIYSGECKMGHEFATELMGMADKVWSFV